MSKNVKWHGEKVTAMIMKGLERNLDKAAIHMDNEVKQELSKSGSGRQYEVGGRIHTASAAGEPPALLFGTLRNSITHETISPVRRRVGVTSTSAAGVSGEGNKGYARRLEYGFVGTDRLGRHYDMSPRPFMRPTFDRNRKRIGQILAGK